MLFPTCQVRVSRFYKSYFLLPPPSSFLLLPPQLRTPDLSGHCRTSTASPRSQRALPDLDLSGHSRTLQISVGIAGSQPRAPNFSGHFRASDPDLSGTSTVSAGSQWPCQRDCQNRCQISCQIECHNRCHIECQNECLNRCQHTCPKEYQNRFQKECQLEYMPERMSDRMSKYTGHKYSQVVCQKLWQNSV